MWTPATGSWAAEPAADPMYRGTWAYRENFVPRRMTPHRFGSSIAAALLLLAVSGRASFAVAYPGLNLSWEACGSDGASNRDFACDRNTGSERIVASFVAPSGITQLVGMRSTLQVTLNAPTLPAWWQLKNVGACRASALTLALTADPAWTTCHDYWQTQALGTISQYEVGRPASNAAVITVSTSLAEEFAGPLEAGTEYHAFTLVLSHTKTVGNGACAGCEIAGCVVFTHATLLQPPGAGERTIPGPASGWSNLALWHSAVPYTCFGVPARNTTWGAIKSLYH